MKDINDIEKSFSELQEYSDTQFRTIVELKKQIESQKEEIKSLKAMLEGNLPAIGINLSELGSIGIPNEQLICEAQITLLKERAVSRELTLEEAKKFQIYTTVLSDIRLAKQDTPNVNVQKLSDDELLKLVVNNNEPTS
jgi:hypothetical protein